MGDCGPRLSSVLWGIYCDVGTRLGSGCHYASVVMFTRLHHLWLCVVLAPVSPHYGCKAPLSPPPSSELMFPGFRGNFGMISHATLGMWETGVLSHVLSA